MDPNWDYLGDLGIGLLSAGGVSTTPRTFGQGLGQAAQFAGQQQIVRQDQAWQNFQRQAAKQKMQAEQAAAEQRQARVEQIASGIQDPALRNAFLMNPDEYLKPQNVGPGASIVSPMLGRMFQGEFKPEGSNLPEGMRMGANGQPEWIPGYLDAQERLKKAGASSVSVTNSAYPATEEQKQYQKDLAQARTDINKAGMAARGQIAKLTRMEQLLDQGLQTGKLAPARKEIAGVAASLGMNIDPKLSDAEAFEAMANELTLSLKNAGGTNSMPGAMSDKDREFLIAMSPGLAKTPQGNRMMITAMKKLAERTVEVERMARDWVKQNGTMEGFSEYASEYAEQNPLFEDFAQQAAPQAAPGAVKFLGFE